MSPTTDQRAADAIRAHHVELHETLRQRVSDVLAAVGSGRAHDDAQRAAVDYLETELMPHAMAEEATLYAAGDTGLTAVLVRAMREEHKGLIAHVGELRAARDGVVAASEANAILALFESHLWKENELLIPALLNDSQVHLSELLEGMHELVG